MPETTPPPADLTARARKRTIGNPASDAVVDPAPEAVMPALARALFGPPKPKPIRTRVAEAIGYALGVLIALAIAAFVVLAAAVVIVKLWGAL